MRFLKIKNEIGKKLKLIFLTSFLLVVQLLLQSVQVADQLLAPAIGDVLLALGHLAMQCNKPAHRLLRLQLAGFDLAAQRLRVLLEGRCAPQRALRFLTRYSEDPPAALGDRLFGQDNERPKVASVVQVGAAAELNRSHRARRTLRIGHHLLDWDS